MVNSAPIAADSVGVAQPADMEATTMTKIETSGTTYWKKGRNFSQPWYSAKVAAGASDGVFGIHGLVSALKIADAQMKDSRLESLWIEARPGNALWDPVEGRA